jgi:hypothetical protein
MACVKNQPPTFRKTDRLRVFYGLDESKGVVNAIKVKVFKLLLFSARLEQRWDETRES